MAQALYIRETDGNCFILNQREKYGDVQIALLNRNRELQRGGGVMTGEDIFHLVREGLNRQSAEQSGGSAQAPFPSGGKTVKVTESMLNEIGLFMVQRMEDANIWAKRGNAEEVRYAQGVQLGMVKALEVLGIPVETVQRDADGLYTAVKISDTTFSVRTPESEGTHHD